MSTDTRGYIKLPAGTDPMDFFDKAYALSSARGMGFLHYQPSQVPPPDVRQHVAEFLQKEINRAEGCSDRLSNVMRLDYVAGRAVKFDVYTLGGGGDFYIEPRWFDHSEQDLLEMLSSVLKITEQEAATMVSEAKTSGEEKKKEREARVAINAFKLNELINASPLRRFEVDMRDPDSTGYWLAFGPDGAAYERQFNIEYPERGLAVLTFKDEASGQDYISARLPPAPSSAGADIRTKAEPPTMQVSVDGKIECRPIDISYRPLPSFSGRGDVRDAMAVPRPILFEGEELHEVIGCPPFITKSRVGR